MSSYIHLFYNLVVQILFGVPLDLAHGSLPVLAVYQLGIPVAALTVGFSVPYKVISQPVASFIGGTYALIGVHITNLILNWSDMKHGLLNRWGRLILLCCVIAFEVLILSLDPDPETSPSMHAGGLITGALSCVVVFSNLDRTHFQRTYLIPMAKWLLCMYIVFGIGWFVMFSPPVALAPGFSDLDAHMNKPCCLRLLECNIKRRDMDLFTCVHGTTLEAISGATAVVKSQTCNAYEQYAGLQITAGTR